MKRTLITAALLSAFVALPAAADREGSMHHGMGPGMMDHHGQGAEMKGRRDAGAYSALKLTSEQRATFDEIRRELRRKQGELMNRMHEQPFHMQDPLALASTDEEAARKSFDAMQVMMKQMFEVSLEAGKRMNAVLTDEQREQLRRSRP